MSDDLMKDIFGGAVMGLIALAMDYFIFQHFVRSPIVMAGGVTAWLVVLYLVIPVLILRFGGKKSG